MTVESEPLSRVEPGYRHVVRLHTALVFVPVAIAAAVADRLLLGETSYYGPLSLVAALAAAAIVILSPNRKYGRLGYALQPNLLRVVRGWLLHTDTIVPLVRVQHIDVTRGPLDKMFGTASLVVHTAGTHNSIVTLPGLAPDRASAIRDEIRTHIRSDFE